MDIHSLSTEQKVSIAFDMLRLARKDVDIFNCPDCSKINVFSRDDHANICWDCNKKFPELVECDFCGKEEDIDELNYIECGKICGLACSECRDKNDPQYKQECGNDCGCVLGINQPIMCYSGSSSEDELTLCNTCYWEAGYWKDDTNEDNKEEIEEYKKENGITKKKKKLKIKGNSP